MAAPTTYQPNYPAQGDDFRNHIADPVAAVAMNRLAVWDSAFPPASIANVLGATMPDVNATGTAVTLTSNHTYLSAINIAAGTTITNLWFQSLGAGSTISHMWAGILDKTLVSPVLLANSPDTTTTVPTVAASTPISYTLTNPLVTTYSGLYYLLLVITASTQPTWGAETIITANSRDVVAPIIGGPGMTGVTTVASYTAAGSIVPSAYGARLLAWIN